MDSERGEREQEREEGAERASEQQILTRLVVLMFSLAARLFELHSLRGFMRN